MAPSVPRLQSVGSVWACNASTRATLQTMKPQGPQPVCWVLAGGARDPRQEAPAAHFLCPPGSSPSHRFPPWGF